MAHRVGTEIVSHDVKAYSSCVTPAFQEALEYFSETIYVGASSLFVVGSLYFWPSWHATQIGCWLYDVGSILFALMSLLYSLEMLCRPDELPVEAKYDVREGKHLRVLSDGGIVAESLKDMLVPVEAVTGETVLILQKNDERSMARCMLKNKTYWLPYAIFTESKAKKPGRRELLEQALYVVGSMTFMAGTIIWDPSFKDVFNEAMTNHDSDWWKALADILFMIGSAIFALAAYVNGLTIFETHSSTTLRRYALAITTSYEFGGFCFIAGNMCFIPRTSY